MFELTVQTGCPFNCSFCSEKILFNKSCGTKYRDVEDIIKIIKDISSDFNEIYFYEDENYIYYQVYNNNIKDIDYVEYIYWLNSDSQLTNVNFTYYLEVI